MIALWILGMPVLVLAALMAAAWRMRRSREARLRALAEQKGLTFRGKALPEDLNLKGTMYARLSRKWNVLGGRLRGREVLVFDCTIGLGKTPWRMTVYALRGQQFAKGERGMEAGPWYLRSRRLPWFARLDSVKRIGEELDTL